MDGRCDRCGARAMRLWLKGELRLYLCSHHSNKHKEALWDTDWMVYPPRGAADREEHGDLEAFLTSPE